MEELRLYEISRDYTKYLYQFDLNVPQEHENRGNRKFVGVVLNINDINYFAPMSSPKPKHKKLPNSMPDLYKIKNGDYGVINLNNMIPVPAECVQKVDINGLEDEKYKILLKNQARIIKADSEVIQNKAKKLYNIVSHNINGKLQQRCCDFRSLEKYVYEYHREKDNDAQKEIVSVTRPDNTEAPYYNFVVKYRQAAANRSGVITFPMQILIEYDGDKTSDREIVMDYIRSGELELPDLMERPHYSEVSPVLLALYDEMRNMSEMDDAFFSEAFLSTMFQDKSLQEIVDEIKADITLNPSLNGAFLFDPNEVHAHDLKIYYDICERIAEDYNEARDNKHLPVRHDIPGEEIFKEIEIALKQVENKAGEDLSLKEAVRCFSGVSAHDVLLSLKKESEALGTRKGSTVLYGTMNYETRKDRLDAYKWAKKWINQSANSLNHEMWKALDRDKGQGK